MDTTSIRSAAADRLPAALRAAVLLLATAVLSGCAGMNVEFANTQWHMNAAPSFPGSNDPTNPANPRNIWNAF